LLKPNESRTIRRNAKEPPMKPATILSLRIDSELRQAAENVLQDGESLSSFVEQSIRESIERRKNQREFIARGLRSRDAARRTGSYVKSDAVIGRLEKMLAQAKGSARK
jgi:hypothetical protein